LICYIYSFQKHSKFDDGIHMQLCSVIIKLTLLIVVVSDEVKAISLFLCLDNLCLINM